MTQQQQSREFDVSDLSSIPWLGRDFRSRGNGCLTSSKSLEPSSQAAILIMKITEFFNKLFSRSPVCAPSFRGLSIGIFEIKDRNATLQSLGCKT